MVDWNLLKENMTCSIRNMGFKMENGDIVISLGELVRDLGARRCVEFLTKGGEKYVEMTEIEPDCDIKAPSLKAGYEYLLIPRIKQVIKKFDGFSIVDQNNDNLFVKYHT